MRFLLICLALLWPTLNASAQASKGAQAPDQDAASPNEPKASTDSGLRFEDFPAKIFQKKPIRNIQLRPEDDWVRENKASIFDDMRRGADFAGHYSMIMVGCGTACLGVRMVDLRNGQVFQFPGSGRYQLDMDYSVKSRLMKTMWIDELTCVSRVYEWTGRSFKKRWEQRTDLNDQPEMCSFDPQPPAGAGLHWDPVNGWQP
jgi:hypothetical protein